MNLSAPLALAPHVPPPGEPPALPIELIDPILAWAVHRTAFASRWDPSAIAQPLNVLSRTLVPLATKAALIQSPHVDLDTATRLGDVALLRLMRTWSKQPFGRPVNYTATMECAVEAGRVDVLDWWMHESGLVVRWTAPSCVLLACKLGHMPVLEWWTAHQLVRLNVNSLVECIKAASFAGHTLVLDWLVASVPENLFDWATRVVSLSLLERVAECGHVHILDWWLAKSEAGFVPQLQFWWVVLGAFRYKHVHVLEWCEQHPQVMQQRPSTACPVLWLAVGSRLQEWIDRLGLPVPPCDHRLASQAAAKAGDLKALAWLYKNKYLVGSRLQLLYLAVQNSASLHALDWIQEHVSADAPQARLQYAHVQSDDDLYAIACHAECLDTLDWLLLHGYSLSKDTVYKCIDIAMSQGCVALLDWLLAREDMDVEQFEDRAMCAATCDIYTRLCIISDLCRIPALIDWFSSILSVDLTTVFPVDEYGNADISSWVENVITSGDFDDTQLEWWFALRNRGSFQYQQVHYREAFVEISNLTDGGNDDMERAIRAVQLWHKSGIPMCRASCIQAASRAGNLAVLDWLLHVLQVPVETFVDVFQDRLDKNLHVRQGEPDWYGRTLLWWRYNIPQVCGGPIHERFLILQNPIHVHLAKSMLKTEDYMVQPMCNSADDGKLALMMYMQSMREDYKEELAGEIEDVLVSASELDQVHVLEWCVKHSGIPVAACPEEIALESITMSTETKDWWSSCFGVRFDSE